MGRSIALGFAREGVDLALAARRPEQLASVADRLTQGPSRRAGAVRGRPPRGSEFTLDGVVEGDDPPGGRRPARRSASTRWLPSSSSSWLVAEVTMTGGGSKPPSIRCGQLVDIVPPLLLVDGLEHGIARGPANRWSSVDRQLHRTDPPRVGSDKMLARTALSLPGLPRNRLTQSPSSPRCAARRGRRVVVGVVFIMGTSAHGRSDYPPPSINPSRRGRADEQPRCRPATPNDPPRDRAPTRSARCSSGVVCARGRIGDASKSRIDAMMTPAWQTATTVWSVCSLPGARARRTRRWKLFQLSPPGAKGRSGSASMSKEPKRALYSDQSTPSASPVWTSQRSQSGPRAPARARAR